MKHELTINGHTKRSLIQLQSAITTAVEAAEIIESMEMNEKLAKRIICDLGREVGELTRRERQVKQENERLKQELEALKKANLAPEEADTTDGARDA